MLEDDCCDKCYTCPGSGERECPDHGGFWQCCDHPDCPYGFVALQGRSHYSFKYVLAWLVDELDNLLDHIPEFWKDEDGWHHARGGYGCRINMSLGIMQHIDTWNIHLKPSKGCMWCGEHYNSLEEDDNEII